jgi:competence protein ComEC
MRKLATAAASFSTAVFLSHYLVPSSWLLYCSAAFAALSFIGLLFKAKARLRIFLILLGFAAGFLWNSCYSAVFYKPAEKLNGCTETVTAVVCRNPDITEYGSKVLVAVKTAGSPTVKTQLYIYGSMPDVMPGNTIRFTARFRLADTMYGEKTEAFLSKGVYLLATAKGEIEITGDSLPAAYIPARMEQALGQMIEQVFQSDTAAFIRALILGDTAGVYQDTALSAALRTTGTSHIIAVSGMNIAFLMGFLGLFIRNKRLLTAIGIPMILLFMSVVGFMPPVVRAGVMQIFLLIAPLFKRENDPVTSLSAALMLILLINPFSAGSVGLQLSFTAILGIMLFTEKIYTALDEPLRDKRLYKNVILRKAIRFVIGSFATTAGALIFTVPLTALHFGAVSLVTPLTNLFILWAVTLAFCGGIVAVILGFIYAPVGAVIAYVIGLPANYITHTIEFFSHVPIASVYTSNPAVVIWIVYIYLLLISTLTLRLKLRQLLYPACLSAVSLCLVLLFTAFLSVSRQLTVSALDVGQGQSIVVTSGKFTAVIDCGSSSGKNAGDIAVKYLQSHGRTTVDLLILTHYHTDHANGVLELLERTNVSAIALPDPSIDDGSVPQEILGVAAKKGIAVIGVTENMLVSFDDAVITLYAPLGSEDENERGLSVVCSEHGFDALITGDMNADIEQRLVQTVQLPDIELLVVGHHGSKHSTSDELLTAVQPETAVISVGYNTYGHPSSEILKKLALNGIMVYRTDEDGSVTIKGWQQHT